MTRPVDLTCKELVEMFTDYLEKRLPQAEMVRFEEHLMICDWCEDYFHQMNDTIALSGQMKEPAPPKETTDKLRAMFRKWKGE